MLVNDLMKKEVFYCCPQDLLNGAAKLLWDHDLGCVPIIDENSRLAGMLTDRDICMAAYTQGRPLHEIPVTTAMSKKVWYCKPEDSLATAENLMRANKVRRLPVVDEGNRLVGLISLSDLALEAFHERKLKRKGVAESEVAETLAAICEPRIEEEVATAA